MIIELNNITFAYENGTRVPVFEGISCTLGQGEFIGVVGATGSGKSTLLQLFTGFLPPSSGTVSVNGKSMSKPRDWKDVRHKMGLMLQFAEKQLFEETVGADVAFGLSERFRDKEEIHRRVRSALAETGLSFEEFAGRPIHHLSSGERRRAAMAGILAMEPDMLFCDEPTIGLDQQGIIMVERILRRLHQQGKTVCVVSHNIDFIYRLTDRIIVLAEGAIVYDAPKGMLFREHSRTPLPGLDKPEIELLKDAIQAQRTVDLRDVYTVESLLDRLLGMENSPELSVKKS